MQIENKAELEPADVTPTVSPAVSPTPALANTEDDDALAGTFKFGADGELNSAAARASARAERQSALRLTADGGRLSTLGSSRVSGVMQVASPPATMGVSRASAPRALTCQAWQRVWPCHRAA